MLRGHLPYPTWWTAPEGTSARRAASSLEPMKLCGWSQAHWGVCLLGFPSVQRLVLRLPSECRCVGASEGRREGEDFVKAPQARGWREARGCCQVQGLAGKAPPHPACSAGSTFEGDWFTGKAMRPLTSCRAPRRFVRGNSGVCPHPALCAVPRTRRSADFRAAR